MGSLLVRASDRGERVAAALRCRGFGGPLRSLEEGRTSLLDIGFTLLLLATGAALVGWDWT
jgi:cobalt/nickel transport system permease protein